MKFPAAYYLLLVYCAAICKPVIPVFQDFVAHTLFKHQHVTTVHQQNGEDHLDIELSDAAKENGTESSNQKPTSFTDVSVHTPVECQAVFFSHQKVLIHTCYDFLGNLPFAFTAIQLPPPKV